MVADCVMAYETDTGAERCETAHGSGAPIHAPHHRGFDIAA